MAKQLDAAKLTLGPKKEINKKKPVNIETAIKKIHEPEPVKEKRIRLTIDVPKSKYKRIKIRMMDQDIKYINSYIEALIDADLNSVVQ